MHAHAAPHLQTVPAYPCAPPPPPVALASNENAVGLPPRVRRAAASGSLSRYPCPDALSLRLAIATAFAIPAGSVIVTAGATEAIELLVRAFPGEVMVSAGTFPLYARAAAVAGSPIRVVPRARDLGVDLTALARAITPATRLVFVANPDNPTGTSRTLAAWLAALPHHVIPVVDEAYADFGSPEVLWGAHPNLVIVRSFSKSHGLAALRVGYAIAAPSLIATLDLVRVPFNVAGAAVAAAEAALAEPRWLQRTTTAIIRRRRRLTAALRSKGFSVVESSANFVCIPKAPGVADALAARGIGVRALDTWGFPTGVRITVGSASDLARLLTVLDTLVLGNAA